MQNGVHVVHLDTHGERQPVFAAQLLDSLAGGKAPLGQDERRSRESLQGNRRERGQRVRVVRDKVKLRPHDWHRLQVVAHRFGLEREQQVQPVVAEQLQKLLRGALRHMHLHPGIALGKPFQSRQHERNHAVSHPHVQSPRLHPLQVAYHLSAVLGLLYRPVGIRQQGQSRLGGNHPFAYAVEEQDTQLLFQLLDLLRQRALRDIQYPGRLREVA